MRAAVMVRRHGTGWQWAPTGGNLDWRDMPGSEVLTERGAIERSERETALPYRSLTDEGIRLIKEAAVTLTRARHVVACIEGAGPDLALMEMSAARDAMINAYQRLEHPTT